MQATVAFYHKEGFDLLKPGSTLSDLAMFCLHKSTSAQTYAFIESDKDLLKKTANTWLEDLW